MTTQPMDLDDNALLTRSRNLRHATSLGDRNSRLGAQAHEAEVRRRFSAFVPIEMPSVPSRRRPSLWRRMTSWLPTR